MPLPDDDGGCLATGALESWLGYLLTKAAQRYSACLEQALAGQGLTPRRFALMLALEGGGPRSQQSLGELLRIDRTTMVAVIDELEERGLVERRRDPRDRRVWAVHLTEGGRDALEAGRRHAVEVEEALLAPFADLDRERLRDMLRVVLDGPREGAAGRPVAGARQG
jgi:DNA-binding MarR family transcriptional regulator